MNGTKTLNTLQAGVLGRNQYGDPNSMVSDVRIRRAALKDGFGDDATCNLKGVLHGLVLRSAVADEKSPIKKGTTLDKVAKDKLNDVDAEEALLNGIDDGQVKVIPHPEGGFIDTEVLIKASVKASKSLELLPWSVLYKTAAQKVTKESKKLSKKASEEHVNRYL